MRQGVETIEIIEVMQVIERAEGNGDFILAQRGCSVVTDQHDVQDDVVIASIGMVLMCVPVAGAYMKFYIADDLFSLSVRGVGNAC